MTGRPGESPPYAEDARLHRAGSAWTDLGTLRLVSGNAGDWVASVNCHKRAVELLSQLPIGENSSYLADLGAAWVNLGCALQVGPSRESLGESLDAFDRAIDLLGTLPFEANPRFRHNLAAAWMNRADALARLDTETGRASALRAYGRAIEIAGGLPLDERPSFRVLLAGCWINKGNLHQRLLDYSSAIRAYDEAIITVGSLAQSGHRLACHHAATAWTNRGEALLSGSCGDGAGQAVEAARMALAQAEGRSLDGAAEAKLCLRSLRVLARSLESLARGGDGAKRADQVDALTDIAERGMDLAFRIRGAAPEVFDPFIVWFFSFGSRAYGRCQPQFLAEYLEEALRCLDLHGCRALEPELRAIARQAAVGALEGLGRDRMLVGGTRQTELLMRTVRELRGAVVNLGS